MKKRIGRAVPAIVCAAVIAAAGVSGCSPKETAVETTSAGTTVTETSGSIGEESAEAKTAGSTGTESAEQETLAQEEVRELVTIDDEPVPLYAKPSGSNVRVPTASGTVTYGNGRATIDASNISQGYVMIKYTGGKERIKVQITKGGTTYTYDLNARDAYEVFPFSEGSGSYSVKVFENVSGNQYAQICSQNLSVNLSDQFSPFLYPNQYVNFSEGSAAVKTGAELAASAADDIGVVTNVFNYVTKTLTYDTAKAQSVQSGYLPDVDAVLAAKKGICFDYAALMTAMLRSQNIPTKLVVGYTGSLYHAWVDVYIESVGWVDNVIYFDGNKWSLMDPTFISTGGNSEEIRKYVGNASNYQAKYSY